VFCACMRACVVHHYMSRCGQPTTAPEGDLTPRFLQACIAIATQASLKEMIAPGVLVLVSPILIGTLCGVEAVAGMLAGAIASSVQLAISMSNTGGAWDNAKKYTEASLSCFSVLEKQQFRARPGR
jgi:Na+/H+-translocating membrane pyrophosphatase